MPSSPDPLLLLELQAAGESLNTWGAPKLNTVISNLAEAVAGTLSFTLSGSKTLTSTNYVQNEARYAVLRITSGTGGTVTIPARSKIYLVSNGASGVVILTAGGVTASVPAGITAWVYCNGTDCLRILATDFNNQRGTNAADPVNPQDISTKAYVDATAFATQAGDYPGLGGNKRKALTVNDAETAPEWDYAYLAPITNIATTYTASNGDRIAANTAGGSFTITLPASPIAGDRVTIFDGNSTATAFGFQANPLTVARNGSTINGVADDIIVRTKGATFSLAYDGTTWRVSLGG